MTRSYGGYSIRQLAAMAAARRKSLTQEAASLRTQIRKAQERLDVVEDELRQLDSTQDLLQEAHNG